MFLVFLRIPDRDGVPILRCDLGSVRGESGPAGFIRGPAQPPGAEPGHGPDREGIAQHVRGLALALVVEKRDDCCIGYAATSDRHTFFRFVHGELSLIDPEDPDTELEDMALGFVEEWIWYDEEQAPVERARYAGYGFPVRGANLRSEKLALLRGSGMRHSSLDEAGRAAREALERQWLRTP